ncbi:MAG: FecR domain-containing protein [Verrucomicrobiota bacterium]
MSAPDPTPRPDPAPPPRSALDWPQHAGVTEDVLQALDSQVSRRRSRLRARAAVATLVLALAGTLLWHAVPRSPAPLASSSSATVSLPARQTLPDGTVVELNDRAEFSVDFSPSLRRVILRRGDAHFAVTKDPARPFVVVAGKVEVRAVGTAFAVQLAPGTVEVLVTEGTVAVDRVQLPRAPSLAIVDAGRRTVVETAAISSLVVAPLPVVAVPAAEIAERLAWRAPRLEFSATPLAEVVALFNAHSRVRLVLVDPLLETLPLSGIVRADNTPALLQLLHAQFGLTAETRGPEVLLRRAR